MIGFDLDFPVSRGVARAVLAHAPAAEKKHGPPMGTGPDPWPIFREAATRPAWSRDTRAVIGLKRDALVIRDACWDASKDPGYPPNLRAALRRRAIGLALVLGESVVDVLARADR